MTDAEKIKLLRETVRMCELQFDIYATNHLRKNPPDRLKSETNQNFAFECGKTLELTK